MLAFFAFLQPNMEGAKKVTDKPWLLKCLVCIILSSAFQCSVQVMIWNPDNSFDPLTELSI